MVLRVSKIAQFPEERLPMPVTIEGVPLKCFSFPSGERHVQIPEITPGHKEIFVNLDFRVSDDIIDWLLVDDVLASRGLTYTLYVPYMPFSRQDRRTDALSPFSLERFHRLLQISACTKVVTFDLHSNVMETMASAVYELVNYEMHNLIGGALGSERLATIGSFASPDKGATEKVQKCSTEWNKPIAYQGIKNRDPITGQITSFGVECLLSVTPDAPILVADDLCDGGGTFIALADAIRKSPTYRGQPLWLYVTHGLFTKGLEPLKKAGYEEIFSYIKR